MPSNALTKAVDSYLDRGEVHFEARDMVASDYYERMTRLRRPDDYVFHTNDPVVMNDVIKAVMDGSIYEYYAPEHLLFIRGYIKEVSPPTGDIVKVTIRPTGAQTARSRKAEMALNNEKESVMKVYEGIIVKLDEQGQAAEVLKVVTPFLAKDVATAQKTVLVDYAAENKLNGKDAAALQVRVREFPVG